MTISFDTIPTNIRVPLAYVEFSNTRAVQGTPEMPWKVLVFGQKLTAGSAVANTPVLVAGNHADLFGVGSMLWAMFETYKANDRFMETWAMPLDDNAAGVAAIKTVTFGGLPTATGTQNIYIDGKRVQVAVTSGGALADIATAFAAAVQADSTLRWSAAVNGVTPEQVDLTAKHKGEWTTDGDIRINYYQGETTPKGLTVTIADDTAGAGNPDITDAIAAMGDEWYQGIIMPYTDAANLTLLETELASRWSGTRMIDGVAFSAFRGTLAETQTFGNGRNSAMVSCMEAIDSPMPPYLRAAAYGAQAAAALSIDPARPLRPLILAGILPPVAQDRLTHDEENVLLYDGVATSFADSGGNVRIRRAVTMYQENAFGVPDPSYLDVTTPATLSYLRYSLRARITQKYPRHKLADDGTAFGSGQAIVTPKTIKAEIVSLAKEWETAGLIEDLEQFKTDLVVERDANNRNRVNVLVPPNLVNQLHIFAAQIQFIL